MRKDMRNPCWYPLLSSLVLTGCLLGPDFQSPNPPHTDQYLSGSSLKKTSSTPGNGRATKAQYFQYGQTIPQGWWKSFHSKKLNQLILAGTRNNPGLAAARASIVQAQENYKAEIGALLPALNYNFSSTPQRFSPSQFGGSSTGILVGARNFNLINTNLNATYTFDFFGGVRRQLEALGAQVDYQNHELQAAHLTLTTSIVSTSLTLASLHTQLAETQRLIKIQKNLLTIIKKQYGLGSANATDVLNQESQLAQTLATLPPLKQTIAANEHALAALTGRLPSDFSAPQFELKDFELPKNLPLSCPSLLVRQRPDILATEALLHAASAQIGVATANLFPQISLNASLGQASTGLSSLMSPPNNIWNITNALAQPVFRGGTLRAQRKAAIAAFQAAYAQYRQTVLQAFQAVADAMKAVENDAELLQFRSKAEQSARDALLLTRKQYLLGATNYLNLLIAENNYLQASLGRIEAQAARYVDSATLFQALGGDEIQGEYSCKKG